MPTIITGLIILVAVITALYFWRKNRKKGGCGGCSGCSGCQYQNNCSQIKKK